MNCIEKVFCNFLVSDPSNYKICKMKIVQSIELYQKSLL